MTNNMASSGVLENIILVKFILTIHGTIGYVKSGPFHGKARPSKVSW